MPPSRTQSIMSAATALAVGSAPAPGPKNIASPTASPRTAMPLSTPSTFAIGFDWEIRCGATKAVTLFGPVRMARPSSFIL